MDGVCPWLELHRVCVDDGGDRPYNEGKVAEHVKDVTTIRGNFFTPDIFGNDIESGMAAYMRDAEAVHDVYAVRDDDDT